MCPRRPIYNNILNGLGDSMMNEFDVGLFKNMTHSDERCCQKVSQLKTTLLRFVQTEKQHYINLKHELSTDQARFNDMMQTQFRDFIKVVTSLIRGQAFDPTANKVAEIEESLERVEEQFQRQDEKLRRELLSQGKF